MKILFEDEDMLVIDKPWGMVVNRAETVLGDTVGDWVEKTYPSLMEKARERGEDLMLKRQGLAHRLDKETSGVLVIGKNQEALENLLSQFKNREVEKEYIALVHGKMTVPKGEVRLPVGRMTMNRTEFGVMLGGRMTQTKYEVVKEYSDTEKNQVYSLVKVWPKTGRTHQIRVIMKHLGHPLVADVKYLSKKRKKRDLVWCQRMFLHARSISLNHPKTKERIVVVAELANDLSQGLKHLEPNNK